MPERFSEHAIKAWKEDGAVVIPNFFSSEEVKSAVADFKALYGQKVGGNPLVKTNQDEHRFAGEQFSNLFSIPANCSPSLNLLGVHPELINFAQKALDTNDVRLEAAATWAKYAGDADFNQPWHCDFRNHTLTVPSEDSKLNTVNFLIYLTDVGEEDGATHYVLKRDSNTIPEAINWFIKDPHDKKLQSKLSEFERSAAGPAGSIFAYSIDVFHRGTNLTNEKGYRYAMTASYKIATNDLVGFTAWQYSGESHPWHIIFNNASPEQLHCFGVPLPGDPFWTKQTIKSAQLRYPNWDLSPYLSKSNQQS